MSAVDTLESVARLLTPEQRERFLAMAARFRTVPEDDEYLQVLEAIGFMTLLWKEVPQDVRRVLEGANPVTQTCENISATLREAVVEAIPSYEDLKQITQRLESHDLALGRLLANRPPSGSDQAHPFWPWITLLIGLGLGAASHHIIPLFQ